MVAFDAWGGSWGSSWGLSWTGEHVAPEPEPEPEPTPSPGAGGAGGLSGPRRRRSGGRIAGAWEEHFEREQRRTKQKDQREQHKRTLELIETLRRKDQREASRRAAETVEEALDRALDLPGGLNYVAALNAALGIAATAAKPRQIVESMQAAEAAALELMTMLDQAFIARERMIDDELAVILLLS